MAKALGNAVLELLAPVLDGVKSPAGLGVLLEELGLSVTVDDALRQEFDDLMPVAAVIDELADAIASEDLARIAIATPAATDSVFTAIRALNGRTVGEFAAWPEPLNEPETWTELARRLPEYLLTRYLSEAYPVVFAGLDLLGAIKWTWHDFEEAPEIVFDWDALGSLVADPAGHLTDVYGWDGAFEVGDLLERVTELARAAGLEARLEGIQPRLAATWWPHGIPPRLMQVQVPILDASTGPGALSLLLVPTPDKMGFPSGVLITTEAAGEIGASIDLGGGRWFYANGAIDATGAIGLKAAFDGVSLESDAAEIGATIGLLGEPDEPWSLFGSDSMRLELGSVGMEVRLQGDTASPELVFEVTTADQLRVVFDPGEGDRFLGDVLGGPLTVETALSASWSSTSGLVFHGGLGLEVRIEIGKSLGPIYIDWLRIAAKLAASGAEVELTVTGGLNLGPFAAVVEDVGLLAAIAPAADGSGNLGSLAGTLSFRPPNGLGLALDIPGVASGGGYLYFNKDASEYAGVADFDLLVVGVTATGLIATQLPDGSDGWSMFMSLAARFVGVQLGFGFTLNGVGGLVGIHRGLDEDALGEAVRTGSLDAILFPEDAVADAMLILADIDAIFPPARDQYVFGPVVKIGWGTPSLIELDVGVAIQLPEPLTISLLGALSAILPDEAAPILELRAAFAGTVNLTEGTLKVDASLSGSQVAGLVITGDMAVRMEFYGSPSFLFAFGGFHPAFDPPACFPVLARLGIAIDAGETLQLALGGYFALSSNSIQFGAFAEFYISEAGFTAEGGTSFDALIIYRPFSFSIRVSLWVSVSAGDGELMCVLLEGSLTGPNPWQAVGTASFKLLGIKVNINIEVTFGDRESQGIVGKVDVQILLVEALEQDDACQLLAPDGEAAVIMSSDQEEARLDPAGRIRVVQRITPLDLEIERYGHEALTDERLFSIAAVGFDEEETEAVEDWFGTEHYFDLDNAERLSAPSFTECKSGITIGSAKTLAPAARSLTYDFEIAYKDPAATTPKRSFGNAEVVQMDRALAARAAPEERQRFTVKAESFTVRDAMSGGVEEAVGEVEGNYFEARTALFASGVSTGVVVPTYELELAG